MPKKKVKKKYKISKKKMANTLLLFLMICAVVYGLYTIIKLIVKPTDYVLIQKGTVSLEETVVGYIIRDENIVKPKNVSDGIIPIKIEGEKAAKGERIFRYHNSNEEKIRKEIEEINRKIQEAIDGEVNLFPEDIKALDSQIESNIKSIKQLNDIKAISEYKKDIDKYIEKKSVIAGERSPAGSYIKKLINERNKKEKEISKDAKYITAPRSGLISYRIDNLEKVLTVKGIKKLNKSTLEKLEIEAGQIVTSSDQMGKIVDNFSCYIALSTKLEEAKKIKVRRLDKDKAEYTR